jgi:hypothetical protein
MTEPDLLTRLPVSVDPILLGRDPFDESFGGLRTVLSGQAPDPGQERGLGNPLGAILGLLSLLVR